MRNLDPAMSAALAQQNVSWAVLCMLTFRSQTVWLWSGEGPLTVAGQVYQGTGSLGAIGEIAEGSDGKAEGTTVTLSGIDPVLLAESMAEIQIGAPATVWLALLTPQMTVIGAPYPWYLGYVDQPKIGVSGEALGITLALENLLSGHDRANNLKYTSADQRGPAGYPDDTGFDHVEQMNDIALRIAN
jgi:hypothetical protein